jgi:starch synthase
MGTLGNEYCGVYEGRLPGTDIPVYFLEHEGYFGRSGMYAENNVEFPDNDRRFIFFSKGSLELCRMLDFRPDLLHVNDWHTAAIPLLLNTTYRHDSYVGGAASLLTIHNMQYQGSFPPGAMEMLGVGWEHFTFLGVEKDGAVNLLKGGIYNATLLNTVSEGYAAEIQTPAQGWGLEGVLRERGADLFGILNGVDYDEWAPETDPYITANYSANHMDGKLLCKRDLQQEMGLPQRDEVPLIGVVGRMVKQKGIDVFAEALPRLLALDLQLVMLGEGEPWAHFYFGGMAAKHPDKLSVCVGYDNGLSHRIEAGADFFLMPSAFEPCGLNQMYSMRYGTLPIVRATGGLDDSVENFDEQVLTGTGFKFHDLTAGALFDTVGWAVHTWYNRKEAMDCLRKNAMSERFTWESAAQRYARLYKMAVKRRSGESP